jgi:hypothetical protein
MTTPLYPAAQAALRAGAEVYFSHYDQFSFDRGLGAAIKELADRADHQYFMGRRWISHAHLIALANEFFQ